MNYSNIQDSFLKEEDVLRIFNISPETLNAFVDNYVFIACRRGTELLYPSINFFENRLNARVSFLTQAFRNTNLSGWDIYQWITEPNDLLNGITPYESVMLYGVNEDIKMILDMKIILERV